MRERQYRAHWKAYAIVKRMRWVALILGPFPIIWDNIIAPALTRFGLPEIVTMEDVIETLLGLEIIDEKDQIIDMQKYAKEKWQQKEK